jgi:hypothetical protein
MKKLLTIFISIISLTLIAQVPQGVGYQGVATDANGIELVNQSISIRASVLSGSATGTIEWEETHATTTDTFGLFTLTIGQGTNTTNGTQTSFADISWGTNTHFLKIEMDVTGGTNYSFMGTNQMMSVPYALYAESAGPSFLGGKVDVGSEQGLGIKIVAVTFSTPFTNPPNVICTASAQPGTIFDDSFNITVRSVTTTGFEMIVNRVDSYSWGQDLDAFWMAFE